MRNLNGGLSQRENSVIFYNEYHFAISLAGNLISLSPQGLWQKLRFKILFLKIRWVQTVLVKVAKLHLISVQQFTKVFHHPLRLVPPTLSSPIAKNPFRQFSFTPNSNWSKNNQNEITRRAEIRFVNSSSHYWFFKRGIYIQRNTVEFPL